MMRKYIFCHGFGFSNLFWQNLSSYFINESCIFLNLGYFGDPILHIDFDSNKDELIGIGHSLGLIKLLQFDIPFKYLIGLNSFVNFLGSNNIIYKKRSIELKALRNSLINNTKVTLGSFYKRCGIKDWEHNFSKLNKDCLFKDLNILETKFCLPDNLQTCIIFAENDIIVPYYIISDNFDNKQNVSKVLLKNGKHSLGFNYPETVKILIDNFVNGKI